MAPRACRRAVGLSHRLSGRVLSQSAYSACSASSSLTASRQRLGRLRRSIGRRVRIVTATGWVNRRVRWRAWRSALLRACWPTGLRPLGMALFFGEGFAACAGAITRAPDDGARAMFERSQRFWQRRLDLLKPGPV